MNFSPNLQFFSYLQYSPKGLGAKGVNSLSIRSAIKSDGVLYSNRDDGARIAINAIDHSAARLAAAVEQYPFFAKCFGPDVTLVPVPRSTPLSSKDALWPSQRICRALKALGLGGDIAPLLERIKAVQKSAFAKSGERPEPPDHFASTRIAQGAVILAGKRITLVDDFVTRGSSFVGMLPHVQASFPGYDINCFALVRTQSYENVDAIVAPVEGTISYDGLRLKRRP